MDVLPCLMQAELFPLLASARGASVTVQAGDMLYLPCCWWHSVRGSPDFNCSFNYWCDGCAPRICIGMVTCSARRPHEKRAMLSWQGASQSKCKLKAQLHAYVHGGMVHLCRFSQSSQKEEQQIYRAHLQRETDRCASRHTLGMRPTLMVS